MSAAEFSEPIVITLNGEPHELRAATSVEGLLSQLDIDPRLVAVEVNRRVVKKARYADTAVDRGAEVEIVSFVGGG